MTTIYTGKGADITWDGGDIAGWREITIEETAAPLPEQINTTAAGASVYAFTADPMGAKGRAKTVVTVSGLASSKDVAEFGIFSETIGASANVVFRAASGVGKDQCTVTSAILRQRQRPAKYDDYVPYTFTFELNGAATWASTSS